MNLTNKIVIVTGASAGIGEQICRRLSKDRPKFVLAARSEDKLNLLAEQLRADGCECLVVRTDVSDPNDLSRLVEQALETYGRIDVLINNAGVDLFQAFESSEIEDILQTIEINLTGAILLARLVIPEMLKSGAGVVINMASTAGKHTPAYASVYGATKAALIGFTQGLRAEYSGRGIQCTAICPGFTKDGGIYDRIVQATGKKTSLALGGTTATKVADKVVQAIHKSAPEMIINWPPMRPAMVLREMFPRLGEKLVMAVSKRFLRKAADLRESESNS
ncbi:MAG: SDR family NAD(P)-dependent oxidoreductase [Fuerstiella sp.]